MPDPDPIPTPDVAELADLGLRPDQHSAEDHVRRRINQAIRQDGPRRGWVSWHGSKPLLIAGLGLTVAASATAATVMSGSSDDRRAVPALTRSDPVPAQERAIVLQMAKDNGGFPRDGEDPITITQMSGVTTPTLRGAIGVGRARSGKRWTCFMLKPGGGTCTPTQKLANGNVQGGVANAARGRYTVALVLGEGVRDVRLIGETGRAIAIPVEHGIANGTYRRAQIKTLTWRGADGRRHHNDLIVGP